MIREPAAFDAFLERVRKFVREIAIPILDVGIHSPKRYSAASRNGTTSACGLI